MGNPEEDREEQRREYRDRVFEILKHMSTLNVATMILLVALLQDFSPEGQLRPDVPSIAVVMFGISLLISMFALFFFPAFTVTRRLENVPYVFAMASIALFYSLPGCSSLC